VLNNDGDIIKGLGFVTLYSAYMEEMIDDFLFLMNDKEEYNKSEQRWPVSRKLKKAKSILGKGYFGNQDILISNLCLASELFEKRNEFVHGRIYSGHKRKSILRSGRPNIPDRSIEPEELYNLANEFDTLYGEFYLLVIQIPGLAPLYSIP
jgi:hypothetical protein